MPGERLRFEDALDKSQLMALTGMANALKRTAEGVEDNPTYRAYCIGTAELFEDTTAPSSIEASDLILEAFRRRRETDHPPLTYTVAAELIFKAEQKQLLWPRYGKGQAEPYPAADHRRPATWRELPKRLLLGDDPGAQESREELLTDIETQNIQTNVPGRYIAPHYIMWALRDRFDRPPRVLDVGTSDGLGLFKLGTEESAFQKVRVSDVGKIGETKNLVSRRLNGVSNLRVPLGPSAGIDIVERREELRRWIYACSLRGDEWNDPVRRQEWDVLHRWEARHADEEGDGIDFFTVDVTSASEMAAFADSSPTDTFDVVIASTMLYQLTEEERRKARENLRALLSPNGVIIYQDFCEKDPDDPGTLKFSDTRDPFTYRTLVEFAGERTVHEFARWRTSRCKELELGRGFAQIVPDLSKLKLSFDQS